MAQALSAVPSQAIVFNSLVVLCVLFLVLFILAVNWLGLYSTFLFYLGLKLDILPTYRWRNYISEIMGCSCTCAAGQVNFIKVTTCLLH